jgi:hypothetical protein
MQAGALGGLGFPEVVVILIFGGVFLIPFYKIFAKAGYPGIMSFAMIVPLLNIIMLFFLAFSEWPILKELKALRRTTTGG